jgi:hypothetical protein
MRDERDATIQDLEKTIAELRREIRRINDKYERLLAARQNRAPAIPNWEEVADDLAKDVINNFDGHRSTVELVAYANYLRAKQ